MARMWSVMMLVVLAAVPAWAQDRDRGWAHLSFGGAFSTAGEETRRFEGRYFGEPFIDQADYPAPKTTWTFDVGGGVWITDRLGVGVSGGRASREYEVPVFITVPSPSRPNAAATARAVTPLFDRVETEVHVSAAWALVSRDRVRLRVFAGPTFFKYSDVLTYGLESNQTTAGGGNVVTIRSVDAQPFSANTLGFHLGLDGGYFFTDHIGVGAMARLSRGSVDLDEPEPAPPTTPLSTSFVPTQTGDGSVGVGGLVLGVGLRLRF